MSHLLYNIAAMRVSVRSYLRLFGEIPLATARLDSLAVDSSLSYDAMAAASVQPAFHPLLEAQILSIRGEYLGAYAKVEKFLASPEGVADEFIIQARFERLFLRLNLGFDVSSDELRALESQILFLNSDDDLAKAHFALYLAAQKCGDHAFSDEHLKISMEYRDRHSRQCAELSSILAESGFFDVPENWWALV